MRIRYRPLVLSALIYIVVSLLGVMGNTLWVSRAADMGHPGCFRADALLVYVRCEHFPGAEIAAGWLSLPWMQGQLLYGVVTGLGLVVTTPLFYLYMLIVAALLWAPVVYILWLILRAVNDR
jgi:hypothetical protein